MAENLIERQQMEATVLKQQIAVAKSMRVPENIIGILETIPEWSTREWLYICALDGVPAKEIERLKQMELGKIREERTEFLRRKFTKSDQLQKDVEALYREVKEACQESYEVRKAIETELETALQKQAQAQEETIGSKNQLIKTLHEKIDDLKQQLEQVKKESEKKEGKEQAEVEVPVDQIRSAKGGEQEFAVGKLFSRIRKENDTKKFIEGFLKNQSMTEEQKEFLLECYEQGVPVKEIEAFAIPGISVDVMKRIKNLREHK